MEAKFTFESPKEVDELFKFPNIREDDSEIVKFLRKNKFPFGIDNLIVIYVIDNPWEEFINAFLNKNSSFITWLRKIYKFHKHISKKQIVESYETRICLTEPKFQELYRRMFECKFTKEGEFHYHPYKCFITILKNTYSNYKHIIEILDENYEADLKLRGIMIGEMIIHERIDVMKYVIEEVGWKFDEEYLIKIVGIYNQDVIKYLYSVFKEPEYKDKLLSNCLKSLMYYVRDHSENIKKIVEYCKLHIDIIREAVNNVNNAMEHPVINFMTTIYCIMTSAYYSEEDRKGLKWITPDIILCLIKLIPPTPIQIKYAKNIIIDYLEITRNVDLSNCIEKIIGCELATF